MGPRSGSAEMNRTAAGESGDADPASGGVLVGDDDDVVDLVGFALQPGREPDQLAEQVVGGEHGEHVAGRDR